MGNGWAGGEGFVCLVRQLGGGGSEWSVGQSVRQGRCMSSEMRNAPCVLCDAPTCAGDHGVLWLVALTQGGQVAFVTCREG